MNLIELNSQSCVEDTLLQINFVDIVQYTIVEYITQYSTVRPIVPYVSTAS